MLVTTEASISTVYVHLLNEGTEVLRPVQAREVSDMVYLLLRPEDYDEEDEEWEFLAGSTVWCATQVREDEALLVAMELADR